MLYDLQQNVLKVIMNTYYGVSGYTRFRLYDREIGAAITSVGRAIIDHARRVIEEQGFSVIYGDTDSCMVETAAGRPWKQLSLLPPRRSRTSERELCREFARRELHAERHFFSIKFEKVYRRFFQAGRKNDMPATSYGRRGRRMP